jgi:hypothetical protein
MTYIQAMSLFTFVMLIFYAFVYVFGELHCYKRGGDVWEWTTKLANYLKIERYK